MLLGSTASNIKTMANINITKLGIDSTIMNTINNVRSNYVVFVIEVLKSAELHVAYTSIVIIK